MSLTQRDEAIASWLAQVGHVRALLKERSPLEKPKRRAEHTAIWVPLLSCSKDI